MKHQQGMVLLLCLIFLTALTLLGLSASAEAILQKKLTSNLKETELARQSAISALSWAEDWLLSLDGAAPETCSSGCVNLKLHDTGSLPSHPEFKDLAWWIEQGQKAGIDPLTGERDMNIAANSMIPPMWMIEVAHQVSSEDNTAINLQVWYRITARGNGMTDTGVSVVESVVMRTWSLDETTEAETTLKPGRVSWRVLR